LLRFPCDSKSWLLREVIDWNAECRFGGSDSFKDNGEGSITGFWLDIAIFLVDSVVFKGKVGISGMGFTSFDPADAEISKEGVNCRAEFQLRYCRG